MNAGRLAMFLSIVLSIWAAMHAYVFWRLASVPWVANHLSRRSLILIAIGLGATYPLARIVESWNLHALAWPLEYLGANWIGLIFLIFICFLAVDLITIGGWVLSARVPALRSWSVVLAGTFFLFGLVQGHRRPVIREHEVTLKGLPRERDGLVLVAISDLHLGGMIGRRWLAGLVQQVRSLEPDLVVAVGDVVDGNVGRVELLLPVLKQFRAPLGVWAVTGNHEYYAGVERSVDLFKTAGFNVLRDRAEEVAPGLVLAGVDDLTVRRDFNLPAKPLQSALNGRPAGATIMVSHTPWQAEEAAAARVELMLSGHTHNGQIWPFSYLVQLRYPLLGGRYDVNGMTAIVCRGTGTWGPRVRLFWPGEIIKITLRAP